MAKSRRNRANAVRRKDPIAKPIKPPADPELAALRESKILPIVNDLKSADPKSRSAAAAAISNIIQDSKCRKLLLREQIVHTLLTQTLTDAALESRAAGWGILQVLAQEEEPDFCVHLFRVDILTAIEFAARSVSETLSNETGFSKSSKVEQRFLLSIVASIVSLLTALAESQDEILLSISSNATITSFLFLLSSHKLAQNEDIAALRGDTLACLMILTEDNQELAGKIVNGKDAETFEGLMVLRKESTSDGVLACGVLHNLFTALQGQEIALNADDSSLIPTLSKAVGSFQPDQTSTSTGWSRPFEYQQLALEILASIGTNLHASNAADEPPKNEAKDAKDDEDMDDADGDDDDEAGDKEGEDEDDEMDQDEMEADMEMVTGADDDDTAPSLDDMPTLKLLLQTAIPEIIRIASTSPNNDATLKLQTHALSALNNIAWSISLLDFADKHNASVQRAWTPVGQDLWAQVIAPVLASDTADIELATSVTSLAWAVARSLRGSSTPLKADEHRKFIALYQATKGAAQDKEDPFQALGVKCIGVLGQLALDPAPLELNREVGTFLITLLAGLPATPVADAVEALNQLFDIYGNEEWACDAGVFWKDNFLKHLEGVLPKARAMVKTIDKREQGELRTRADEAVMNLSRFLAYKRKNKPQ